MALFDDASLVTTPNGYKAGTLYSIKPTSGAGDMTVVRATTATRVNSAGLIESVAINVPRLDYLNASCPSLLVEPQRTNLALYSEQFDNAAWTKTNVTITANATSSPSGTTSADKIIANASGGDKTTFQLISITIGQAFTISAFFKKSEYRLAFVRAGGQTGSPYVIYNLDTEAVVSTSGASSTKIEDYGNGWYRILLTLNSATGGTCAPNVSFIPDSGYTLSGVNIPQYTGDGTSGGFVWGCQLEANGATYATSYIPTTTAAVTRNADVISKTGISSLIGQTEGTIFVDYVLNGQTNNANILNSEKNTTCSLFMAQKTNGNFDAGLYASAVLKAKITAGSIAVNQRAKVAYAYKSGNSALYINGVQVGTSADTYTLPSTLDDIFLNDITTYFSYQENVSYNQATLFQTRLTNAELATLTTL